MKNHPLFKDIDISKHQKQFMIKKYPAKSLLFHEGDECNHLGIILEGQLIISTLTSLNKEYIINILNKDDFFGDTLLFLDKTLYLGDGIISKDAKILFISKELLLQMFKDQTFLLNYLQLVSKKGAELRNRVKLLSHKSIEDRILFYLDTESKKLNTKKIPIKSKEKLAQLLNIPRPSLSRELINLKNKKYIDYDRNFITLL